MPNLPRSAIFATIALTFAALPATAKQPPDDGRIDTSPEFPVLKQLWDDAILFKDKKSGDFELRSTGRFQGDLFNMESNRNGTNSGAEVVKLRLGFEAKLFQKLTFHIEGDLDPDNGNNMYKRLTDAYLAWEFSDHLKLTVGKQPVRFTLDGGTSSAELLTLDRNQIWNNLWPITEFFNGARLAGKEGHWQYSAAYFTAGNKTREFGDFTGSDFGVASLGYDFGPALHAREALLRFDYNYSEKSQKHEAKRPFEDVASLSFQLDEGRWGVSTDFDYGVGRGKQGDVWGIVVMPWYNLTSRLQAVLRGTYMKSDSATGLQLLHYDDSFASGDSLRELYAGLNYYFYGHRLKLQTGLAFADVGADEKHGGNYREWSITTGVRVNW